MKMCQNLQITSQYAKNSIWTYLKNKQNHGLGSNRCNDWYVGSVDEINALRNSNLEPTWFDNDYMWSSSDNTGNSAWTFDSEEQDYWRGWTRQSNTGHPVCFIRSF